MEHKKCLCQIVDTREQGNIGDNVKKYEEQNPLFILIGGLLIRLYIMINSMCKF